MVVVALLVASVGLFWRLLLSSTWMAVEALFWMAVVALLFWMAVMAMLWLLWVAVAALLLWMAVVALLLPLL